MWRNWLLAAAAGWRMLRIVFWAAACLRTIARTWDTVFPAMPGAGSRFAASSNTILLLFVNIKTFQLDEYKINVDKT